MGAVAVDHMVEERTDRILDAGQLLSIRHVHPLLAAFMLCVLSLKNTQVKLPYFRALLIAIFFHSW